MPSNTVGVFGNLWHRATRSKYTRRYEKREEWRTKATKAWNARLPIDRSSGETCPVRITGSGVCPQSTSLFFQKLPLEIRRLIYSNLLADHQFLFKVVDEDKSLNGNEIGKEKIPFKLKCQAGRGLLSFPLSCKLAHTESFHYLYSRNVFRLAGITEYWCFMRLVSTQCLDLIQDLHLQYSYLGMEVERDVTIGIPPFDIDCWEDTWGCISKMKRLVHVRVDIHRYEQKARVHAFDEKFYFSPLKNLQDQIELEVRVSWEKHDSVPPDEEIWPFTIRRGMVYHEEDNGNFSLEPQ